MNFEPRKQTLKDNHQYTLRPTQPTDAQAMIDYLKQTAIESPFLLRYPDEITFTLEKEEEILQWKLDSENELMMLAESNGVVAGNVSIFPLGGPRRVKHRCKIAIALKKDYWNIGLGTALMTYAIELAKQIGYEQVELEVIDGNDRGKALYKKMGFEEIGRLPRAIKYDDGTYRDEISMVKFI